MRHALDEAKPMKVKTLTVIGLFSLWLLTGCGWFGTKPEKPAPELARDGVEAFNSGNYRNAIESFETLKDWYPFSKYAILAELKIADAHYRLYEYDEAVFAYEEFENLHPRNEAVPYVIYQIGRCYFDRIDTVDRDQTSARKALDTFTRLSKKFPEDAYALKARGHIIKCQQSLAGNDFYVGHFYYKTKHYKAALARFQSVLVTHPDVGLHYQALQYIVLCEAALQKKDSDAEQDAP
jgi:outer membrane protein assembly factor BamD